MARPGNQTRKVGVRSLERGLALLIAMNRRKLPSVVELARDTRLPRPTVYRLLETLNHAGFVTRSSPADGSALRPRSAASATAFWKTTGSRMSPRRRWRNSRAIWSGLRR